MSGNPYNSVLRSGLTRRLWLIIFMAMLVPVALALFTRWFEAEERRASLQNQELTTLSRDRASALLFNGRAIPDNFARNLAGRYLVVLDGLGGARYSSAPVPDELVQLFAHRATHAVDAPGGTTILAWFASGREWRGAMTYVPPVDGADTVSGHTVVVFAPEATFGSTFTELVPTALGLFALVLLMAFAVAALIAERYLPPLSALHRGLARLRERRFETLPRVAVGEFRPLEREFNLASMSLQRDWRAFEVLGEVDRALLAASEIDRALDVVLPKFRELTRSECVGVVLLDPTAHSHGRLFTAALGADEMPVQRVTFDGAMISTVRESFEGLTIARAEESRHAFLGTLRDCGAEFFWLWPVLSQEHISAVLAVGYAGVPQVAAEVAGFGTECAARIGVALSNSARGEQLYHQAHHDQLTGLPNRLLFRDRLSQELASAADGHQRGALMYVDLDHFKKINDTVGHNGGDQVLQIVAQRLRACIKEVDTVARLGGDEFTLILRNVGTAESAHRIASRVSEALQEAVNIGGRDHHVGASIGITLFPDDATVLDELMRNADLAMYRAKADGRARVVFYNREMQRMPALVAESGLHNALQRREFSLYYQPQYALGTGKLSGLEALLRWQPPREAMRYPGQFVPAAEQSGLIVDIGAWVLEAGCEQMAEWSAAKVAPPRLALNVSVFQLRQPDFHKLVRRTLERTGVAPDRLEFELTESVFADEDALATLHKLSALGVYLSLDDFGTGYSSLGYLRAHPVQSIKIDRSFIEEVATNLTAATLAETMITMAHALGKKVVAEGVETMQQLEFLRERRCDFAQGFFLARPAATSDITALLQGLSDTSGEDFRATA